MGNVRRKLLHETLKGYVLYAIAIVLLSTPFFYLVIQKLHLDDVDETLLLRTKEFKKYTIPDLQTSEIDQWNRFNRDMKIVKSDRLILRDSLSFQFIYDTLANELEPYRILTSPVTVEGKPFVVSTKVDLIESEDLVLSLALLYSGLLLLLLTGLFFITQYYSKRLWQPFYRTLYAVEQFEIDKTQVPELTSTAIEEFYRLNQVVRGLVSRSRLAFLNQQEFIENAAHELQTPLAIFQSKLDNFLQHPDLTASQLQALGPLYDLLARLNRMNKNLLVLSKIDHQSYDAIEPVDLAALLKKSVDFFEDQAVEKGIFLETRFIEVTWVNANIALIEILISNLLMNAIAHNRPNGSIEISLNNSELIFRNTGISTAISDDKLFQRFAKTDSTSKGNGLGLSIVKRIADLYGWQILYEFENGFHTFAIKISTQVSPQ
ncbi:sensor histidine kinase [Dyadobacter luticola]|uniref:histidine kinase n=1 Tax=Dyadobacter luticola TaxID=1979387 RepID=A0A5R9KZ68_9BACT|nr:HAMP domain-containing sensor histidine kinase [Dyadobacter luticola]TLV01387.1 HAMP domain-containing histidine kinase [Dyadobacter luticola]